MSPTAIFALKGDKPIPKKSIYFKNPQQNRFRVLDAKIPLQQISCFLVQTCQHAQTHNAKNPHGGLASK